MSDTKASLEAQIAQLEEENKSARDASTERNRKLRALKNQVTLETAHLWVICDSKDTFNESRGFTQVEMAGVSREFESRVRGCVIKPHSQDGDKCLIRILTEGPVALEFCLRAGQDLPLTVTEGHGKKKEQIFLHFWVFDTFEAAENKRLSRM